MLFIVAWILSFLGAIGGVVWTYEEFSALTQHREFNRLFQLPPGETLIIVCPSKGHIIAAPNTLTTHEAMMALAALQVKFVEHGKPHEVRLHEDLSASEKSKNLFLISGPTSNSITKALFEHPEVLLPFKFKELDETWIIVDSQDRKIHPEGTPRTLDYAIIAKLRNPWAPRGRPSTIYLAAGIHGLGTWGAAYYLSKRAGDLSRRMKAEGGSSASSFAALVRVEQNSSCPPTSMLLDARPV